MSRALIITVSLIGLLVVAQSNNSKYKKKEGRKGHHYWNVTENARFTWEEAEGYLECEEFLDVFDQKTKNRAADNFDERGYYRKQDKPRALENICGEPTCRENICRYRECVPAVNITANVPGCGFNKRNLYSGNWTTTHIDLDRLNGTDWFRDAYLRLHYYRNGDKNSPKTRDNTIVSATMSFYVPTPYQKNPPASLDKNVRVEHWDKVVMYSRTWGGGRDDEGYWPRSGIQFDLLGKALSREDIKWETGMRITASYIGRRELILVDREITVTELAGKNWDSKGENV
ncbi:hypothetical protein ACHWQZ_G019531 [Mnemiopsis leidyi]